MHEEDNRSTRYLYRAHRTNKHSQLNVTTGNVAEIPIICGGDITAASRGSSSDKRMKIMICGFGNDIGGFGGTNNADKSDV